MSAGFAALGSRACFGMFFFQPSPICAPRVGIDSYIYYLICDEFVYSVSSSYIEDFASKSKDVDEGSCQKKL